MADAYPAFGFKYNSNAGTGSGPMGGPGPFAPSNTPVYSRRDTPVNRFLDSIGVAKVDENGQATGTTGGSTFMWNDQRAQYNELLGAEQGQPAMGGGNMPPPSAAPANSFLPPAATGGVRVNGTVPATLAPGGTPLLGREYAAPVEPGAGLARLGSFAQGLLNSGKEVRQDGAIFSGKGGKLSITQDPGAVPMNLGAPEAPSSDALSRIIRGATQFSGPDQQQQIAAALAAGTFNTAPQQGAILTQEQQAALAMENAGINKEAASWLSRMALPNAGTMPTEAYNNRMGTLRGMANRTMAPEPGSAGPDNVSRLANEAVQTTVNSRYDSAGTFVDRETGANPIAAVKDKKTGKVGYMGTDGKFVQIDQANYRPVTTSDANTFMDAKGFNQLRKDILDEENSIKLIDKYMGGLEKIPQGVGKLATQASKAVKTLFTREPLTEEEMTLGLSEARQQALLGALRTSILGPGVLTEIDAQRIIARMGGDVSAITGNPELMKAAIQEVLDQKVAQYESDLGVYNRHVKGMYNTWGEKERESAARKIGTQSSNIDDLVSKYSNPQNQ